MRWLQPAANRKLFFQSYLFLVVALVGVATALNFAFSHLQSRLAPQEDRWLEHSFRLAEAQLAAAAASEREAVAARLSIELGVGVQLLEHDDIAATGETADKRIRQLTDATGRISYLRDAPALGAILRVGPVEPQRESLVLRLLPPFFYLSILVIVGLWLKPLLNDINLIAHAAQRFAADYREPLATAGKAAQLTELARNLDDMSRRLSSLIQGQKELTAALSHEMRTPLARIRFALAVADHHASGELKAQLRDINADVDELDALIASVLEYARLDHPDLRMHWERVPLGAWLEQTLDRCRHPDVSVSVAQQDDLDFVWMDPRLMALAVSNLVVNACRYARAEVRLTVERGGAGYRLAVEDDGAGVPEAARDAVFKAFSRLDDSRNRDTGGHGLGLAIVARIAALHGGRVCVDDSAELGGASFRLTWAEGPSHGRP